MASGMVGTRLSEEVLQQVQKKADAEGKKVSDLLRELLMNWLAREPEKDQGAAGGDVVARLDKLVERLEQAVERKGPTGGPPILRTALGLQEMEKRIMSALAAQGKEVAQSNYYARAAAIASCKAARTMQDNEWPDEATIDDDINYYDNQAEKAAEDFLVQAGAAIAPILATVSNEEAVAEAIKRIETVQKKLLRGIYLEAVMTRYWSRMTTTYAIDIEMLLEHDSVSDKESRESVLEIYDKGALEKANEMWERFSKPGQDKKETK